MLQISGLNKSYGVRTLFDNAGFVVNPMERVGLVGRNGSGKSTLFKIILGEEHADSGAICMPPGFRIGHLSQHIKFTSKTALDEAVTALPHSEDGRDLSYKAATILSGLGFDQSMFSVDPLKLSGGYQVRLNLAKAILSEPDMMLLDEPTNYLDILSSRWLVKFLRSWRGELILITHDRDFMDAVATHTMAINRGGIIKQSGGTQALYERLASEEERYERERANEQRKRREAEKFINRFRAQATRASMVQSRIKALGRHAPLEKRSSERELDFSFNASPIAAKRVMDAEGISFSYSADNTLISDFNISVGRRDRIGVIGKNGRGKSTLMALLAGELSPQKGNIRTHPNAKTAYFGQTNIDRLNPGRTIEEEIIEAGPHLTRTQARGICGAMLFEEDEALKKINVLSGGERSRVLLGRLLVSPSNLLILDEPTNHLDMQSIDSLIEAVADFDGAVIIVTHSELILSAVAERLIVFDRGGVGVFDGTYDDFLSRVGWGDEDDVRDKTGPGRAIDKPSDKRRVDKRQKAGIINERSRTLNPIKERIKRIEAEIESLENKERADTEALLGASKNGDGLKIGGLSKSLHETKNRLERLYGDLTDLSAEFDRLTAEFDENMKAFM